MISLLLWSAAGFAAWLVVASFFEWVLHRYVMHRPLGALTYPFRAHAVVHHGTFRADHTYHLQIEADKKTIPMEWWNGPVLIAIALSPVLPLAWATGHWALALGAFLAMAGYYCTYESVSYTHLTLPTNREV